MAQEPRGQRGHRRREGHRRRGLRHHRRARLQPDRGRGLQAPALRGRPSPARHRPGRGRDQGRQGHPPQPQPAQGPAPPGRLLHLPGPLRRGQDRARQVPGRVPLWQPGRPHLLRHVRVHGEAHGLQARRRPSRIRGLRRGRRAHQGRPQAPVLRRPLRRDRKGPPRRV